MELVRKLRNPQLVANFQSFCGVAPGSAVGKYKINNQFFYYFFRCASVLGQEEFCATVFPMFYWNFDRIAIRRMLLLWSLSFYVGQYTKTYLALPRPHSPPVHHLEQRYIYEHGTPSTHAVAAVAIPIGTFYFASQVYVLPNYFLYIALLWSMCSGLSRVYLGVHSFWDIIFGAFLGFALLVVLGPLILLVDFYLINSPAAIILLVVTYCAISMTFPTREYTAVWSDSVSSLGTALGLTVGCFMLGRVTLPEHDAEWLLLGKRFAIGLVVLRTCIGVTVTVFVYVVLKELLRMLKRFLFGIENSKLKMIKFRSLLTLFEYTLVSFVLAFFAPFCFAYLHIDASLPLYK